jgi:hypothetical protein
LVGSEFEIVPPDIRVGLRYYNFGRIHQTLGVPPAMKAGVVEEIVSLLG